MLALQVPLIALAPDDHFEHLNSRAGLSHDSVYAILQDRQGLLWLATEDGLNRYDGYRFEVFRHDPLEPSALDESDINALLEDDSGRIWVGTWGGGITRLDPTSKTFSSFQDRQLNTELRGLRVQTLYQSADRVIWIGTYNRGLYRIEPTSERLTAFSHQPDDPTSLSHPHVWSIAEDGAGLLWVATEDGLDLLDPTTGEIKHFRQETHGLSSNNVLALHRDSEGILWAGTTAGLDVLLAGAERFTDALQATDIVLESGPLACRDLFEDHLGALWIATREQGLLRLAPDRRTLTRYEHHPSHPESLASNDVRHLFEDRSHNLWVGTRGGGVSRIDLKPRKFHHFHADPEDPNSLKDNRVWSIMEDRQGILWIGTSSGLTRFDRRAGRFTHYEYDPDIPWSLRQNTVRSILEDRQGQLWIGTNGGGLNRLDRNSGRFSSFQHEPGRRTSLSNDSVLSLYEDRQGALWVGTGGGLNRLDRSDGSFTRFQHQSSEPDSLSHDRVLVIREDDSGSLWIGTDGGGLNRFDRARERFDHFRHSRSNPRSLSNDNVMAIHQDASGQLWIGTHGGLNRFDPESRTFTLYTDRDGLPDNFIYGILEDSEGNLWLPTNRGLATFHPESGNVRVYEFDDGLGHRSFNEGASFESPSGEMFIGGTKGFNTFHPQQVVDNPFVPPIVVTECQFLGDRQTERQIPRDGAIEVGDDDSFIVRFAALDYTSPERNQYRYRLDPVAEEWNETREPAAFFTHLAPGRYVLRVTGSNNDGIWNPQGSTLAVQVQAPFWRTWWFRASLSGGFLLLVLTLHRQQMARLRQRAQTLQDELSQRSSELERQREIVAARDEEARRFTYVVSHDLRSPLVTIKGFLGELRSTLDLLGQRLETVLPSLEEERQRDIVKCLEKDAPQALHFLESSATKLNDMLKAILTVSRLSRRELDPEPVDLRRLVEELLSYDLSEEVTASRATIELGSLPEITIDRDSIRQILEHLLRNAAQYLDPERPGKIFVSVETGSTTITLQVRDNGVGMTPGEIPRAFEILRRVGRRNTTGKGMGLAFVKALVRRLEGTVECVSDPGVGSTFSVTLPLLVDGTSTSADTVAA